MSPQDGSTIFNMSLFAPRAFFCLNVIWRHSWVSAKQERSSKHQAFLILKGVSPRSLPPSLPP